MHTKCPTSTSSTCGARPGPQIVSRIGANMIEIRLDLGSPQKRSPIVIFRACRQQRSARSRAVSLVCSAGGCDAPRMGAYQ